MVEGSLVAIVTPMKDGMFDRAAFKRLVEFQITNGTAALVVCGCTGEPATLSMAEHEEIVAYAIELARKRVPVIAGTGSNNTKEAIHLTKAAEKAGADGALLITPYYNKPTPRGLFEHYTAVAGSVGIPLILYNVPSRTGISILPETVAKLAGVKNIVGIKEASGSMEQVSRILELCPKEFMVWSGDDAMTLPIIAVGGRGGISVAANVIPKEMARMTAAALADDWAAARKLHLRYLDLFKHLFIETNPIPVKTALNLMGMVAAEWRLPLTPPLDENREKIRTTLKRYGLIP